MKKALRLREREAFARLRQDGRVFRHSLLTLTVIPNELSYNRYGVIATKRLGKAVQRNRSRRLIFEAFRLLHPTLRQGHDVLAIPRDASVGASFPTMQHAIHALCQRANLMVD